MSEPTKSQVSKSSTQPKKKADVMLIVTIILIVIAIISLIITIGILFGYGNKSELADQRSQIVGAGAMFVIATILAIILAIMIIVTINAKKAGKPTKNLNIATIIIGIATGIFLMIGLILAFVTANQINTTNSADASGLRAAGAFGLIAFVFFAIAFVLILIRRGQKKNLTDEGKKGTYQSGARRAFGVKSKAG